MYRYDSPEATIGLESRGVVTRGGVKGTTVHQVFRYRWIFGNLNALRRKIFDVGEDEGFEMYRKISTLWVPRRLCWSLENGLMSCENVQ